MEAFEEGPISWAAEGASEKAVDAAEPARAGVEAEEVGG